MAENFRSEKSHQSLFPEPILCMKRDKAFGRPAQKRHFVFHCKPTTAEVPGIQEAEKKAGRQKSAVCISHNPINAAISGIRNHPRQPEICVNLRITEIRQMLSSRSDSSENRSA
jgi:hypothetical protein